MRVVAHFVAAFPLFVLFGLFILAPGTRQMTRSPVRLTGAPRRPPPPSRARRILKVATDLLLVCVLLAVGLVARELDTIAGMLAGLTVARVAQLAWLRRWQRRHGVELYWHPRVAWRRRPDDYCALPTDPVADVAGRGAG